MDLYARKIIAWTLADTMEVSTVIETINNAKACRNTDLPFIIHSDRGSQYVSNAWREVTEKMQQSYSHSGYPYDNACIESFHSLIKREWLNRFHIINYTNMPIGLYLSILKPFIIPLGFTAIATICLLMILKNCLRGYLLCQQLSWQNSSFYFVLNLDTGPYIYITFFITVCWIVIGLYKGIIIIYPFIFTVFIMNRLTVINKHFCSII